MKCSLSMRPRRSLSWINKTQYYRRNTQRITGWTVSFVMLSILGAHPAALAAKPPAQNPGFEHCMYGLTPSEVENQADQLLHRMTLDEKIRLLSGNRDVKIMGSQPIKRLGIPLIDMPASSCGVMPGYGPSTAYPATVCLAATWDRQLAYQQGVAIGNDCLARGINMELGLGVNIQRVPQDGRNFEFLGEDPFLTSAIAVNWIRGVQSRGVAACVKHYVGYESGRDSGYNSIISRRALEEIYMPPFRAAIRQAHVWSIMCAYNRVNGTFCSENTFLLTDILRQRWGFRGVLMSDWGATHSCVRALNAGLDMEMPMAKYYTPANIRSALKDHKVTLSAINTHVRRILRMVIAMGWLQHHHYPDYSIPLDDPASAAVALRVAEEGTVLLKNKHHIMPLRGNQVKRIVVWGPMAGQPIIYGDGSATVEPIGSNISMLTAISQAVGPNVKVHYLATPLCVYSPSVVKQANMHPAKYSADQFWGKGNLRTLQGQPGADVEYFNNRRLFGPPAAAGTVAQISCDWGIKKPVTQITSSTYSVRWRAVLTPSVTGAYAFAAGSLSNGTRVFLNGRKIINNWRTGGYFRWQTNILNSRTQVEWLRAGKTYHLRMEYYHRIGRARVEFGYALIARPPLFDPADQNRISSANVVIACVGFGPKHEGEGWDRGYHLWGMQDHILRYLAARNKHVIVVVNAGAGIGMSGWIHKVAGLVYAWYPGEYGNTAVAKIICGQINPSGRLPDTFSRHWRDEPAYGNYPAVNNTVDFAEGIYVGYRWYDKKNIKPLYPFGFGLSYTTFSMNNLHITATGAGPHRTLDVAVRVTNTGAMAGAQVVELYIHPMVDRGNRCVQTLQGFARVALSPGQGKTVHIKLNWRNFAYYRTARKAWRVPPGKYEIAIGSSSADQPLHKIVRW